MTNSKQTHHADPPAGFRQTQRNRRESKNFGKGSERQAWLQNPTAAMQATAPQHEEKPEVPETLKAGLSTDAGTHAKHISWDLSPWNAKRMALWAVALSVGSTCAMAHYILLTEGGGPLLVAVVAGSVFRLPFLGVVFWRLKATPDPSPEMDLSSGPFVRRMVINAVQILGTLYHLIIFLDCLKAGSWPGLITTIWWMIWLAGMAARERARAWELG